LKNNLKHKFHIQEQNNFLRIKHNIKANFERIVYYSYLHLKFCEWSGTVVSSTQQNVGPLVRLSTRIINYIHWKFDFYILNNIKYNITGIIVKIIFTYF